ncbi:MAG: hypothetical protein VB061_07715 [Christensenella sp.]|nr:hypothetical protein [Christensenella sp.]
MYVSILPELGAKGTTGQTAGANKIAEPANEWLSTRIRKNWITINNKLTSDRFSGSQAAKRMESQPILGDPLRRINLRRRRNGLRAASLNNPDNFFDSLTSYALFVFLYLRN